MKQIWLLYFTAYRRPLICMDLVRVCTVKNTVVEYVYVSVVAFSSRVTLYISLFPYVFESSVKACFDNHFVFSLNASIAALNVPRASCIELMYYM